MLTLVNFDNAATTFPKPYSVKNSVDTAFTKFGGNPGRSGHILSLNTAKAVYSTREACADFFGAEPENVVFTLNCTHALNVAIKGIMSDGGHIITSDLEHNSVIRPIYALSKKDCTYSLAHVEADDNKTVSNFEELINSSTKAIVCTLASNVTGQILPIKKIAEVCHKHNICFILDGAQGCGILPLKLSDGVNIICTAGHKGLYGPSGTGLLITDGEFSISSLIEGGTGSSSLELDQPDFLPDSLESGTVNTMGILGLGAGVKFVSDNTVQKIFAHEDKLCRQFISGLSNVPNVIIYRNPSCKYVPIVSFNIKGLIANETAQILSDNGFCLRGGLHCSGLAHKSLGTAPDGTVRFAPSIFNNEIQTNSLILLIKKICQKY